MFNIDFCTIYQSHNDKNSFMILGGGKGNEPLVFNDGGNLTEDF